MRSGLVAALSLLLLAQASPARVVQSRADLPDIRFPLAERPSAAFLGDAFLRDTVPALRREAEQLLTSSRIEEPGIARQLRLGLVAIAVLQGRQDDALRLIAGQRAAETKPQLRAVGYMLPEALARARRSDGTTDCNAAAAHVAALLGRHPAELVRDEALARYGRVQVTSGGYYAASAVADLDPDFVRRPSIDLMDGLLLAYWRLEATGLPPCRAQLTGAFSAWLSMPQNRVRNIWAERAAPADFFNAAQPVRVAIWDSGFDTGLFADRLVNDPAEPLDGRDNDRNGVVDDVHGPTFTYQLLPTSFSFPALSAFLAPRLALESALAKGELDVGFGVDTPEASAFAERARTASAEMQGEDVDAASELHGRSHGTFVASIIARDAPWARLYNLYALPWGEGPRRLAYAEPEIARWAALMPGIGRRLRGAGIRVVNLSWAVTVDGFARDLRNTGVERDQARARTRAETMYRQVSAALEQLIRACPEVLFVVAAGNSNQSEEVFAATPQRLRLPNVIVVGAASESGRPTDFTTYGANVRIYAQGNNVSGLWPGGIAMRARGTSMAAPFVARAAAAMLAVNPRLRPQDVVEGLLATSTEGGEGNLKLMHESHAVTWARSRRR